MSLQGIGGALFEAWRYSDTGEPISTTFAAYHLPLTTDVPNIVRQPSAGRHPGQPDTVFAGPARAAPSRCIPRWPARSTMPSGADSMSTARPTRAGELCRVLARCCFVKPAEFTYHRPDSVAETLSSWLAANPDAKLLAGGQSLLTLMNLRLARPSAVIDIGRLTELNRIFDDTEGSGARRTGDPPHRRGRPPVAARAPLLAGSCPPYRPRGYPQPRHHRRFGGSCRSGGGNAVGHAGHGCDLPCRIRHRGQADRYPPRRCSCRSTSTAWADDEMITWVSVPSIRRGSGVGLRRIRAHQHGDYGLAGGGMPAHIASGRGGSGRCGRRR